LVTGLIAAPARRTVCGMHTASGASGVWHHSRAHRFLAATRWNPDHVGLVVLGLIIGWLVPSGARATGDRGGRHDVPPLR
jgi:hypothetical protein